MPRINLNLGICFIRKRIILARIKGIQENLLVRPNSFLVDLERKLRWEYVEVAKLEEEFWAMKARILWLVEGIRNTTLTILQPSCAEEETTFFV